MSFPILTLKPIISRLRGIAILLAMALTMVHSFAQQLGTPLPESSPVIRQIQVVQSGGAAVSEAVIRGNMLSKEGDPYSPAAVDQDIKNLYANGIVDNVSIDVVNVSSGVNLVVRVSARAGIGEIAFVGNEKIPTTKLVKKVEFKIGEAVSDQKLQKGRDEIIEEYRKKGYSDVDVSYRVDQVTGAGFSRVTYLINEGEVSVVRNIRFEGNTVVKDKELRKVMKTKERSFLRVFTKSGRLDNPVLLEDFNSVARVLQNAGYKDAKVLEARRERVDSKTVDLVLVISEGQKFEIAKVGIGGNKTFSLDDLAPLVRTVPGTVYAQNRIDEDKKRITDFYWNRGYADVIVNVLLDDQGGNQLEVVYSITENNKSYIDRINIAGNEKTMDKVIRRELAIAPGDEFDRVKLEASRSRLQNLGYFSNVDVRSNDSAEGFKSIDIDVEEKQTGSLNFGAGFSSTESLVGFLEVQQSNFDLFGWPNFTGAGQKFRATVRAGAKRRDFSMSLTEPWFLDQQLALGGELFYRDLYYLSDYYVETDMGGAVSLRKPTGEFSFIRFEYKLQNVKIHDFEDDTSPELRLEEGSYLQSMLSTEFVHDTRDSPFITRRGHKFSVGAQYSGGILGGDVDVWGLNANYVKYWNLPGDHILQIEGSVATVENFGGDRVPIFSRLFLGGANNLRGFAYRDIGPRDSEGEPLGGGTSAYATVEYSLPIVEQVRLAFFYDIGFLNPGSFDFSLDNLNSNVGIGLRLFLPIGPLNVDFGYPIQSDEHNGSGGKFHFNIGYQF